MSTLDVNPPYIIGEPGRETVLELQQRMMARRGPDNSVVMMFTSSDNPHDREQAAALDIVKGDILKPMDDQGIDTILKLHHELQP
jgi:flagellar biosynthesis/type III secretory pathway ATPase